MARTPMFGYDGNTDYDYSPFQEEQAGFDFFQTQPNVGFDPVDLGGATGSGTLTGFDPSVAPAPAGFDKQAAYNSLFGQSPAPAPTGQAPSTDPFAAMGGGVQLPNGDWVPKDHPLAAQAGAQAGTASSAGSVSPGQTGNLMQDFSSALRTLINGPTPKQAGQDVLNSAPVTAFNANAKRNEARDRQFLAERAAAGGYSGSGGFESGVLGLRQRTNEAMDRFAGEQANIQEQGRRDELLRALSMAMAFGDAEAARALQAELGRGSLAVQREGIASNRDTALDQLGYNYANMQNSLNQNWLASLFGGL